MLPADKAIEILSEAIDLANDGGPQDFAYWQSKTKSALRLSLGADHPALGDFEGIRYSPSVWAFGGGAGADRQQEARFAEHHRKGIRSAVSILRNAIEEVRLVSDHPEDGGAPAGLHPIVRHACSQLVADGHHRQAVENAARAVEQQLRSKLKVNSGTGSQLVAAFSPQEPKRSEPRLRFQQFEPGSDSWRNAHEGALHFGKGCYMRLRNLYTHHVEPTEAEATEALAAFSLLARWVDEADPLFPAEP